MKTVLVTGGNKGIGMAACKAFAEKGWRVFLGARDATRGKEAVQTLAKEGHKVELIEIDVSDEKSIAAAAKALGGLTDRLDALVNNAGVYLDRASEGGQASPDIIRKTFETNTLGPLLVTRALIPLLEKAGGAQVINVSSGMGQLSDMAGGSLAYRISKTSLNAVTRVLANELAAKRIAVNSICPGWVKTDMGGKEAPRAPEQGADTIVWLATGESDKSGQFYRDRKAIPW